jgi:hypothetical protein
LTNQKNKFSFKGRKNLFFFQKQFPQKNKEKSQISKKFSDGFGLFEFEGEEGVINLASTVKTMFKKKNSFYHFIANKYNILNDEKKQ